MSNATTQLIRPAFPRQQDLSGPEDTAAKISAVLLSWPFGVPEQRALETSARR